INLPLGILALIFITFFYKESRVHRKQKIDWFGAITLVGAVVSLMFALPINSYNKLLPIKNREAYMTSLFFVL
ncbi:MAG: hypothetical protein IJJ10_10055, partial [Bacillus sp. (in: Bacteria)]|nr:hypothetical protein [Bacillus sp. (in: firmicutes)]